MRRRPAAAVLERRYRRLLGWYPADYRAANGDDMLSVALARSAPGQRWPDAGEAGSLMLSGIRCRLGAGWRNPVRRDTAAVLTVAGPVLLAAVNAQFFTEPKGLRFLLPGAGFGLPVPVLTGAIAAVVWWTLVAAAAMHRRPRIAACGAWLGLMGQAGFLLWSGFSWAPLVSCLLLLIALMTAVASLGGIRAPSRPLSWPAALAVAAGAAMIPGWPAIEAATVTVHESAGAGAAAAASSPLFGAIGWFDDGALACAVVVATVATAWLRPAVRRRVAPMLALTLALVSYICWQLGDVFIWVPPQLSPFGLVSLVLVPVAGIGLGGAGVAVYRRYVHRTADSGSTGPAAEIQAGPAEQ